MSHGTIHKINHRLFFSFYYYCDKDRVPLTLSISSHPRVRVKKMHLFWGKVILFLQFFLDCLPKYVEVATCREGILEFTDSLNFSALIAFLLTWHIFHKSPRNDLSLHDCGEHWSPQLLYLQKQSSHLIGKKSSAELIVHIPILWGCA